MAPLFVFLLWSWFFHLVDCIVFLSLGLVSCMVFKPFKPRPVFVFFVCVPLLFLCLAGFVDAVFYLLFSSLLSGAGETQTPFGGFGVPLVFLRAGRDRTPWPRPAPVFFFPVVVIFFSGLGVFLVFVLVLVGFLAVFLVLLWVVACKMILMHLGGVGRQDISRPLGQLLSLLFLVLGEGQCPAEIDAQFSAELVSPPYPFPVERCKIQPRKGVGVA